MWLIGSMWKCSNTWSWGILIGRKLDREYSLLWEIDWKYGDDSERETPVPIPNTEVKPLSADGTRVATPRESRSSPDKDRLLKAVFCAWLDALSSWSCFDFVVLPLSEWDVPRIPKRARIGIKKRPPASFLKPGFLCGKGGKGPFVFVDVRTFLCRGSYERLMSVTSKSTDSTARMSSSKIKIIVWYETNFWVKKYE